MRTTWCEDVLLVELDRPEKRNAISRDIAEQLEAALDELMSTPGARCGILAAVGPVFSAGTDLYDPRDKRMLNGGEYGLLRRVRHVPLIAAVDGPALGGGFEIVLACDLVVASRRARFGLPEGHRGLVATGGGLFRTARALPHHLAVEMLLTGGTLDAERGYALGLVNRLVDDGAVIAGALALADEIRAAGPEATSQVLQALRGLTAADDHLGWELTAAARNAVKDSAEAREGVTAFAQRRAPEWVSRTMDR